MNISFVGGSEKSALRNHNEDRFWISPDRRSCAVLDGHAAYGAAADVILRAVTPQVESRAFDSAERLAAAVAEAERTLLVAMRNDVTLRGSGTTLDLMTVIGEELIALHVGDGRIYRFHGTTVQQLSTDHTLVAGMVARGEISRAEARNHPRAGVITRALGGGDTEPEIIHIQVAAGDFVVACTDGIWHCIEPEQLAVHLQTSTPTQVVKLATAAAQYDNGTIVIGAV